MTDHVAYLKSLGACSEARDFAAQFPTLNDAWQACNRSDWMLWLLRKTHPNDPRCRHMALDFAESVVHLVPVGETAPPRAIDAGRGYLAGTVTQVELESAADAAVYAAAYAADAAVYAAVYAARAAARAADAAARAADAADAAARAAYAAARAADAVYAAARAADAERQKQVEIIRSYFPAMEIPS